MTFTRRTIIFMAAVVVLCVLALRLWTSPSAPMSIKAQPVTARAAAIATPLPETATAQREVRPGNLVSYAVAVSELHGLPPHVAPGTRLEIWVAWEPPVTRQPDIRPLLDDVLLEEISPPLLPDGPHVASLLVRRGQISDLFYGDRYGSLSVVVPQAGARAAN